MYTHDEPRGLVDIAHDAATVPGYDVLLVALEVYHDPKSDDPDSESWMGVYTAGMQKPEHRASEDALDALGDAMARVFQETWGWEVPDDDNHTDDDRPAQGGQQQHPHPDTDEVARLIRRATSRR